MFASSGLFFRACPLPCRLCAGGYTSWQGQGRATLGYAALPCFAPAPCGRRPPYPSRRHAIRIQPTYIICIPSFSWRKQIFIS